MSAVEGFEVLTGTYLGQDWRLFGETVDEAIVNYAHGHPTAEVAESIAGFEHLLASELSEVELADRWIMALDSGYDPRDDGHSMRQWFAHALEVLRGAAAS